MANRGHDLPPAVNAGKAVHPMSGRRFG